MNKILIFLQVCSIVSMRSAYAMQDLSYNHEHQMNYIYASSPNIVQAFENFVRGRNAFMVFSIVNDPRFGSLDRGLLQSIFDRELFVAYRNNDIEIIRILLNPQLHVDIDARVLFLLLGQAVRNNSLEIVELLLAKCAQQNVLLERSEWSRILHSAVSVNDLNMVDALLRNPWFNKTNEDLHGRRIGTAVSDAIKAGHLDMVLLLLTYLARKNMPFNQIQEMLEAAFETENDYMVGLLLAAFKYRTLSGLLNHVIIDPLILIDAMIRYDIIQSVHDLVHVVRWIISMDSKRFWNSTDTARIENILDRLLSNQFFIHISKQELHEIMREAMANNRFSVVEKILRSDRFGDIDIRILKTLFEKSVIAGREDIMLFLWQHGVVAHIHVIDLDRMLKREIARRPSSYRGIINWLKAFSALKSEKEIGNVTLLENSFFNAYQEFIEGNPNDLRNLIFSIGRVKEVDITEEMEIKTKLNEVYVLIPKQHAAKTPLTQISQILLKLFKPSHIRSLVLGLVQTTREQQEALFILQEIPVDHTQQRDANIAGGGARA